MPTGNQGTSPGTGAGGSTRPNQPSNPTKPKAASPANMPMRRGESGTNMRLLSSDDRYWATLRKVVQHGGNVNTVRPKNYFGK